MKCDNEDVVNTNMISADTQQNQINNKILEGTLIHRKGGRLKKNMRMYTVFDMSGAAGASLEVGGMGSLKCYRFTDVLTKKDAESAYSSTKFSGSWEQQKNQEDREKELCFNVPGHFPWTVVDVENDPSAFVVQISTSGFDTHSSSFGEQDNDSAAVGDTSNNVEGANDISKKNFDAYKFEDDGEEDEEDDNDDGFFDFWGGGEDENEGDNDQADNAGIDEDMKDQVQLDLSRAAAKNKPFIAYAFKCPSSVKNEKALWLAAFQRAGRLSEESKKKKSFFGGAPLSLSLPTSASQRNSRIRSSDSFDAKKITSVHSGDAENETNILHGDKGLQKEYRVRPNYAYLHQWMTNSELTEEMEAPSKLMHDTRLSPAVVAGPEIGHGRGGRNANAVVYLVCGSYAFSTDIIEKCQSPMWLRGMRRACALPIYHGYASLIAGVFHDDGAKGTSSKDTFLGRVEVPIAQLRPNTTSYDVTLPLRQSNSVYTRKKLGAVRLRISLEYYDDRQAIRSYLPQRRNRFTTTVACADPKSFRNIARTVHGAHLVEKFSPDMLKAAIREMSFAVAVILLHGKQFMSEVISWRKPIYSAYSFVGWMHCVYINSMVYLPLYTVGFALLQLVENYGRFVAGGVADFQPPSWREIFSALYNGSMKEAGREKNNGTPASCALGFREAVNGNATSVEFPFASFGGYPRIGVEECLNDSKKNSDSDDKMDGFSDDEVEDADTDHGIGQNDGVCQGALKPLPEQNMDVKIVGSNKSIADELKELELKVHKATKHIFDYQTYHPSDGQEPPFGRKISTDKGSENYKSNQELDKVLGVGKFSQRNPLVTKVTSQFIPVARILAVFLSLYRSIYSIFTWRDPILTFCFFIGLLFSILVFSLFPWRLFLFLGGFVLLGPQNWLIRVFKEHFLSSEWSKRPGRILRAAREFLRDDDGKYLYSKDRQKGLNDTNRNISPQPVFHCHAPASNPLLERTNTIGVQHIIVPYSSLYFNRFQDWPPTDPTHARVCSGVVKSSQLLCTSSGFVSAPVPIKRLSNVFPAKECNEEVDKSTTSLADKSIDPPESEKSKSNEGRITSPPQSVQRAVESNVVDNDSSQLVDRKKKNRFATRMKATRMAAKFQPALMKYKQTGKNIVAESSATTNAGTVNDGTASTDEGNTSDGIPSTIETVKESDRGEIGEPRIMKNEDKHGVCRNAKSMPNLVNQVTSAKSEENITCEEEKSFSSGFNDNNEYEEVADAIDTDQADHIDSGKEISKENKIDNPEMIVADDSSSPGGIGGEVGDDLDLQPCPSSDSNVLQLQQLLAIKVELATVRTENDNYCMLLKKMEAERDVYKKKYMHIQSRVEKRALVSVPSSTGLNNLFNRKDKNSK
eukprot:CAMPEP_0181131356 /NCGR_PEP_ID=MMETSP1071-20121207/30380_1 /TAXON_ID=35127 /ORGANISM="Thalassiosira sp., Strain NH16" /LENGTH=1366 /DNA_ID=CAMNT_0023217541 /DNA_START=198 /DNA_END=4297 /DNA_ORIENTATION=-